MKTKLLPENYDYLALDNTEIRLLLENNYGGLAHGFMHPNSISAAITHRTVHETWFILSGQGLMWRKIDDIEQLDELKPNTIIEMPLGVEYQFATDEVEMSFLIVTMPPWPGDNEVVLLPDQDWQKRLKNISISNEESNSRLHIQTVHQDYQHRSAGGAEVRLLCHNHMGSIAHYTLKANNVSKSISHKTTNEFWYVLSGEGQIWRKFKTENLAELRKDISIDIPHGTKFQYRAAKEDLVFIGVTMPPAYSLYEFSCKESYWQESLGAV